MGTVFSLLREIGWGVALDTLPPQTDTPVPLSTLFAHSQGLDWIHSQLQGCALDLFNLCDVSPILVYSHSDWFKVVLVTFLLL